MVRYVRLLSPAPPGPCRCPGRSGGSQSHSWMSQTTAIVPMDNKTQSLWRTQRGTGLNLVTRQDSCFHHTSFTGLFRYWAWQFRIKSSYCLWNNIVRLFIYIVDDHNLCNKTVYIKAPSRQLYIFIYLTRQKKWIEIKNLCLKLT